MRLKSLKEALNLRKKTRPEFQADPIIYGLVHSLKTPERAYLFGMATGVINFILGLYWSMALDHQKIVPLWEINQLIQAVSATFVISPTIFAFSVWLPLSLQSMITSLEDKKVIAPKVALPKTSLTVSLRSSVRDAVDSQRVSWVSLIIAVALIISLYVAILPGENSAQHNRISPYYGTVAGGVIYGAYLFFHFYLITLFVFHVLAMTEAFTRFFSQSNSILKVSPLDPDRSGGFQSVGQFALKTGSLAVIMGWLSLTTTLHPTLTGGTYNTSAGIIFSVIYVFMVPVALLLPIWSTHKAMKRYRDGVIKELSDKADAALADLRKANVDVSSVGVISSNLGELAKTRKWLLESIPVWPFGKLDLGGFSFVAIWPFVVNLITFGLSLYHPPNP